MISFVVAIYIPNKEILEFTKNCITELNIVKEDNELIIIDDCSPLEHDIKVDYRFKKNKGVASAWNKGIKLASNDIIVIVNSDTFGFNWKSMLDCLREYDIVFPKIYNCKTRRTEERLAAEFMMFTRELIEDIGYFNEDYGMYYEDTDFFIRALDNGKKLGVCKEATVNHISAGTVDNHWTLKEKNERVEKSRVKYITTHNNRFPKLSKHWKRDDLY